MIPYTVVTEINHAGGAVCPQLSTALIEFVLN